MNPTDANATPDGDVGARQPGRRQLALELSRLSAHDAYFTFAEIRPVLRQLLPRDAASEATPFAVYCLLLSSDLPEARALAPRIHASILRAAVGAWQRLRQDPAFAWHATAELVHLPADLPITWQLNSQTLGILQEAASLERDIAYLRTTAPERTNALEILDRARQQLRQQFREDPRRWSSFSAAELWAGFAEPPGAMLPPHARIDARARDDARLAELARCASEVGSDPGSSEPLRQLISWADPGAAPYIIQGCVSPQAQAFAAHAMARRSGGEYVPWLDWTRWLERAAAGVVESRTAASRLAQDFRDELRLIWLDDQTDAPDPAIHVELAAAIASRAVETIDAEAFARRREPTLTPGDVRRIRQAPPPVPPSARGVPTALPPPPVSMPTPRPAALAPFPARTDPPPAIPPQPAPPSPPAPPPAPPEPTLWDEHLRPLLAANWYIVAGLLMVVAGASLLGYFTWDESALVRYLLVPVLLAVFTAGLAETGVYLLRRHEDLCATGTFLLGGAVCLLPANFMVLGRAGGDLQVAPAILGAFGVYATLAVVGLWRWCGAVRTELRTLLALPLLAINVLAVLGDLPGVREAVGEYRALLVPVSFTAAALFALGVVEQFLRGLLTRPILDARTIPWFVGITLAATTLQVALWRHFHLGLALRPADYALAVILAGAALLRWERRAGELRNSGGSYGGESFLGYAALLLGVLMAAGHAGMRIGALLLTGVIWLIQAERRPGVAHQWIGVTLCLLAGSAVGMLDGFPKNAQLNLLPVLGVALTLIAGALRVVAGRQGLARLRQVALEIQPIVLILTAILAVLSQYHLRSVPWQTGLVLVFAAGFFAVRATLEARRDWVHIAAACAALSLPYLGCADMVTYRFEHNTLALGFAVLAILGLAAERLMSGEPWRSVGLRASIWFGGAGALALLLRIGLSGGPELRSADLAGGLLLAASLVFAAWHGGSRFPGYLAAGVLAVLLPQFRVPADVLPAWMHVGSGVTSAAVATVLILASFELRRRAGATEGNADAPTVAPGHRYGAILPPVMASAAWLVAKALLLQAQPHATHVPFATSAFLVAVAAYLAAIYFRTRAAGSLLLHASWPLLGAGFVMVCHAAGCRGMALVQFTLLWLGITLSVILVAEHRISRTRTWAAAFLVRPRLAVLAWGSIILAGLLAIGIQIPETNIRASFHWLALFLAAQLAWHGMRTSVRDFGLVLYALVVSWLCHWRSLPQSPGALPAFLLAVLLVDVVLEQLPRPHRRLVSLRAPFVASASVLVTLLALASVFTLETSPDAGVDFAWPRPALAQVIIAALLVARAQACAGLALPPLLMIYLLALLPCTVGEMAGPWRSMTFALVLVGLPFAGRALQARWPRLLTGSSPQLPGGTAQPQAGWLLLPAMLIAVVAATTQVLTYIAGTATDACWIQVLVPFAAATAYALAGFYWRHAAPWTVAACLVAGANLFGLSALWGESLLATGLMAPHVVALAGVLTLVEFALVRRTLLAFRPASTDIVTAALWLHRACLGLAGLTLVLIATNYLANPGIQDIPVVRLATSGVLALAAGIYFRVAARRPENVDAEQGAWMESLWHVSLGLALWCAALIIPALRTPHGALYALALPAIVCWVAAERLLGAGGSTEERNRLGGRFRMSACAFAGLVIALYGLRIPFQLLLFPEAPLGLDFHHTGAAACVAMGCILIRVRGLGAPAWSALAGGLALIVGLYFLVSWLPGLSPFEHPMAGAWTAVGLAHMLIALSFQQSPVRALIQHAGRIEAAEWHAHRTTWGLFLTIAVHIAVMGGVILGIHGHAWEATPLLILLASVLVHQALIGAPWLRTYWALAATEFVVALHLDFVLPADSPGLIPARSVVWLLLLPWLAAVVSWERLRPRVSASAIWAASGGLAGLSVAHLLYHGASSGSGLLIALGIVLASLATPPIQSTPRTRTLAGFVLLAPAWLAGFGTGWLTADPMWQMRPLLAATAAVLAVGMIVRQARAPSVPAASRRLLHDLLDLCQSRAEGIARSLLGVAAAALAGLTFAHPGAPGVPLTTSLTLAFVWAICAVAWFREGRLRDGWLPYALSLVSLAGGWIILRRLLFQHFSFWTYEYDLWLSLGASIAFSAVRRLVRHERPGLAKTVTGAVWLLPVLQCALLFFTRMDADLTLIVIGVQSLLFAWQGGGRRDSPYNAIAMLGFVAFVCLLFWAKLDLRYVQAYAIPCGAGVLGLVWLFGNHMTPALRGLVRLVTIAIMLGSCGYYALLDDSFPVAFHMTMLLVSLGVMALGPVLRVHYYLYLGFAGFATDLVALVVKQFVSLNRSVQMMSVGALLLLLGMVVVGGAILYKTHREQLAARFSRLRARLAHWE